MRNVSGVFVLLASLACLGGFYLEMGGQSSWNEFTHNLGRMSLRNDAALFLGGFVVLLVLAFLLLRKKRDPA